ncbi:dihydroorotate dehydrogenase electron transfer subunit [Amphibacillus marinus]|uniref:Dihydroorotate dehydrogenase B (NAD(+)), electron transfer subunit n=1 Tax=Amphibacillus marinus TaxID=872970 RepID=A0A1H8I140_9BACI|nr:dihydroorotate dehydrogenase electron transfer subunit [Amphibacillus marinus]SEN61826.1 dihydroorotate dehydrogenase electron transfer subunit [Amphibacillus marinus]
MEQAYATVHQIQQIAKATYQMDLLLPSTLVKQIKPGQFVHVRVSSGTEHMLRRPISVADVQPAHNLLTIIFKVFGEGTAQLAAYKPTDQLDLLIPSGNGYPIEQLELSHALLVGGGIGVPPLHYLAKQLVAKGVNVTAVLGFQTADDIFYQQAFEQLGTTYIVTNDGSYGAKGFVTDVLNQEDITCDYYFSCGPTPMLKAIQHQLADKPGYISLEERMGCGIGACYACVIPNKDQSSHFKICQDGPVFSASEVVL